MNPRFFTRIPLAVAALAALSCGDSGSTTNLIDLAIHPMAGSTTSVQAMDPYSGAQYLRFSVSGAGMADVSSIVDFSQRSAMLPSIPYGYGRQVKVEACAAPTCDTGSIVSRGFSVPTTVLKGDSQRVMDIFVAPRNSFSTPVSAAAAPEPQTPVQGHRTGATLTVLNDYRVLITGGADLVATASAVSSGADLATVYSEAEVFDPKTGLFTALPPMSIPRAYHQAVRLKDGRVVIMGGFTKVGSVYEPTPSVEIFDPNAGAFYTNGVMPLPGDAGRALFTAELAYQDMGAIFLAGGLAKPAGAGETWDLYMPEVGPIGHGFLSTARFNHTMTFLPDYGGAAFPAEYFAFVLMGGQDGTKMLSSVEPIVIGPRNADGFPVQIDLAGVTELPGGARVRHQTVYVPQQGIAYVIGGFSDVAQTTALDRIEIYREGERRFNPGEVLFLGKARGDHTALLMDYNTIFIAGGRNGAEYLDSAEVIIEEILCDENKNCYYSPSVKSDPSVVPVMPGRRSGHTAVFDATRRVMMVGGLSSPGTPVLSAIFYNPD